MKQDNCKWLIHTPNLLKEILSNPTCGILTQPLNILGHTLFELAECAIRINDPELNAIMCQLTLYSISDPESPDYDRELLDKTKNYVRLNK